MLLDKAKTDHVYRPMDIFTLDALLFMAHSKQWPVQELTPVRLVPLQLGTKYHFANIREPEIWGYAKRYDVDPHEPYASMRTAVDYEEVDLVHIAWGSTIWYTHWRVGWRSVAKELVVGLDRNNEYVHIERRDVFK